VRRIKTKRNKIRRKTIFNMTDAIRSPYNVTRSSGMTCHWIRPNVLHIAILLPVSVSTISPQSTCHSAPVCEILSKSDRPRQKNDAMTIFKMACVKFYITHENDSVNVFLLTCGSTVSSDGNQLELFFLRTHSKVVEFGVACWSIPVRQVDAQGHLTVFSCQLMKNCVA